MALVKSWEELKQREPGDPSATIAIQAAELIARVARDMVEGSEQLPPAAEAQIMDAIAKAGSGAFQRAYERALAGAMRVIIDLVADQEAERRRQEVIDRLRKKQPAGPAGLPAESVESAVSAVSAQPAPPARPPPPARAGET
jgi:hypothetical protein